jgi:formate dehydrogenase subunit gamma
MHPTPATTTPLTATQADTVRAIVAQHANIAGPLMPILHAVQEKLGYVPPPAVALIAEGLNLTRAEVHGVVTFYHDFAQSPRGRCRVRICQAESCQAMGSRALTAQAEKLLGTRLGETRADGAYSLEPIYCLGLCALSPAAMIDDDVYGKVTPALLSEAVQEGHSHE